MAKMYPSEPDDHASYAEREVFKALEQCPKSWVAFSDVGWIGQQGSRLRNHQTDFLLVVPRRGLLVIEVKGGEIRTVDGKWETKPRGQEWKPLSRSPVKQAEDARYAFDRYVREHTGESYPMGHAVVFPGGMLSGGLGSDAPPELVVDRYGLPELRTRLERILSFWDLDGPFEQEDFYHLKQLIFPTVAIRPNLKREASLTEQQIVTATGRQITLTEDQLALLKALNETPRALIVGSAGTGKTMLAIERARRLAQTGGRVLLTCHSDLFAHHLRQTTDFEAEGLRIDILHRNKAYTRLVRLLGSDRFKELHESEDPYALLLAYEPELAEQALYDAIVLDEAQEFGEGNIQSLMRLLVDPDKSPFYAFADPFQQRHKAHRPWIPNPSLTPLPLRENCRNSAQIAGLASRVGQREEAPNFITGQRPQTEAVALESLIAPKLAHLVRRLIAEGFSFEDISIISLGPMLWREALGEMLSAETDIASLMAEIPEEVNAEAVLRCDEVGKYHGLESEVVIVVIDEQWIVSQPTKDLELHQASVRRDLYIAFTRARSLLLVVGTQKAISALQALQRQ